MIGMRDTGKTGRRSFADCVQEKGDRKTTGKTVKAIVARPREATVGRGERLPEVKSRPISIRSMWEDEAAQWTGYESKICDGYAGVEDGCNVHGRWGEGDFRKY
jgi:hypothetical protein